MLHDWFNGRSNADIQLALDAVYDSEIRKQLWEQPELLAPSFDLVLQAMVEHVCACEFDMCLATLSWRE